MPSSTSSAPDKSRQTSGGKSFFGRKLHKDRPADDNGGEPSTPPGSSSGSRSSRHSKRASVQSFDMGQDADASGLAMTAGVITSIPFESLPPDPKTPIPVDSLSRMDASPRREPTPAHLAKNGVDFHQYPPWNPQAVAQSGYVAYHPSSGARPPPHVTNTTMAASATGDKGTRYQQWGRPGSSSANAAFNSSHNSSSTVDSLSSSNPRLSVDQSSIHSSVSSNTRGSSYQASDNSSRTLTTSFSTDRTSMMFAGVHTNRYSHPQGSTLPSQPAAHPGASALPQPFISPEEYLTRPKDDRIVDQLFLELMQKRGWQNLPEQAKRQMLAYPASKKWTLVHQDRLTELQGEMKRRQHARPDGPSPLISRAEEEGSPEWYVRKVMDDTITSKQLGSLSVSLRTQPIR
mgnify:CR=1 FL=1